MIAEPRDQYLARADHKRKQAAELRAQGLSVRRIAEQIGVSKSTAGRYVQDYENVIVKILEGQIYLPSKDFNITTISQV